MNMDLSERLITLVDELSKGNAKQFAEKAGIKQATLHNYLNGRTPSVDSLYYICRTYNVNLNWLVTGNGPKYIEDKSSALLDPDPEIAQLMEGARRVLTSGNPIAFDALERNIRYFDHAIAAEKRADEAERQIREMREVVSEIQKELIRLKRTQRLEDGDTGEEPSSGERAA